jgi:hypothetical protein
MSDSTVPCARCRTRPATIADRLCPTCRQEKDRARSSLAPAPTEAAQQPLPAAPEPEPASPRVQEPEPDPGPGSAHKKRGPRPAEAMKGYTRGPRKSRAEWQQIARSYVQGFGDGYKILARENKVSVRQIKRRSKAEGWPAQRAAYMAQLRARTLGLDAPLEDREPTWTFRANDHGAALAIRRWANERELHGGADPARTELARSAADAMDWWRNEHRKAS